MRIQLLKELHLFLTFKNSTYEVKRWSNDKLQEGQFSLQYLAVINITLYISHWIIFGVVFETLHIISGKVSQIKRKIEYFWRHLLTTCQRKTDMFMRHTNKWKVCFSRNYNWILYTEFNLIAFLMCKNISCSFSNDSKPVLSC